MFTKNRSSQKEGKEGINNIRSPRKNASGQISPKQKKSYVNLPQSHDRQYRGV